MLQPCFSWLGVLYFLTVRMVGSVGWIVVATLEVFGNKIHATAFFPQDAIVIHEVYEEGAAARDGRLWAGDQILEVNYFLCVCAWVWRFVFSSAEVPCRLNRIHSWDFRSVTENVLKNSYYLIYSYKLKVQIENTLNLIEQGSSWIT